MHHIFANNKGKLAALFVIVLYLLGIGLNVKLLNWGDDAFFTGVLHGTNLIDWGLDRYVSWSGRIIIDALMVSTINSPIVWTLLLPASILLASYSMAKIAFKTVNVYWVMLAMMLIAIIPPLISSEAIIWVTGFYNYLLPLSLAIFTVSVMLDEKSCGASKLFALLAIFIFSYQEQVVIIFIITAVLLLIQSYNHFKLLGLLLSLANAAVLFMAPGNYNRLSTEVWRWYPQYMDYGFVEKVMLGYDKLYQAFTMPHNWPLLVFLALAVCLTATKKNIAVAEKVSMSVIVAFIVFSLLHLQTFPYQPNSSIISFYRGEINPDVIVRSHMYICYAFVLVTMSSVLTLLVGLLNGSRNIVGAIIVTLFAAMSIVMIGFSPTVYASTWRVDFVFEVMLIMGTLFLLNEMIEKYNLTQSTREAQ
ncbi:hypothetical protein ABT56_09765 [Photobacterium aquae]|uniref:Uncharacterized protein n=1 Tax=Photobacterium aquae TaxID=1195763 RepID=A0A0J1H1X5_9GAMM|nr:hypothetical protein [Photobacterium aquae]KLV05820.1 hypothetical protein ABT56_09765 [Photobacterium aquae]